MALKKIVNFKGVNAEYWRINQFEYNDLTDEAFVTLGLYANEEAKDKSMQFNVLDVRNEVLKDIKLIPIPTNIPATNPRDLIKIMLYSKLKTTEFFKDAEDC